MATILKVRRLSGNPRARRRRNVPRRNRRMTAKQIRYFGTPAQKAALRRRRTVGNRRRRLSVGEGGPVRNRRRRRNTALVVSLGAAPGLAGMNPRRKRRRTVARVKNRRRTDNRRRRRRTNRRRYDNRRRRTSNRRRRSNPRRRRVYNRRRRRNRTIYVHVPRRRRRSLNRRRRRMSNRRRYSNRRHRRNPSIMGMSLTSKGALKLIGGGLIGVAAVKFIPRLVPAGLIPMGGSPYMTVLITGVSAVLAGWLIGKMDRELGDGATFGGLMVAGSQLINAIAPGLSIGGVPIGGLGELMPGQFAVPQNPLRLPPPPQPAGGGSGARVTMSGLARAFGPAF